MINVHKLPYARSSAVINLSIVGVDVPGDPIKVGFAPKRTAREVGPYKRIIENSSQKAFSSGDSRKRRRVLLCKTSGWHRGAVRTR